MKTKWWFYEQETCTHKNKSLSKQHEVYLIFLTTPWLALGWNKTEKKQKQDDEMLLKYEICLRLNCMICNSFHNDPLFTIYTIFVDEFGSFCQNTLYTEYAEVKYGSYISFFLLFFPSLILLFCVFSLLCFLSQRILNAWFQVKKIQLTFGIVKKINKKLYRKCVWFFGRSCEQQTTKKSMHIPKQRRRVEKTAWSVERFARASVCD